MPFCDAFRLHLPVGRGLAPSASPPSLLPNTPKRGCVPMDTAPPAPETSPIRFSCSSQYVPPRRRLTRTLPNKDRITEKYFVCSDRLRLPSKQYYTLWCKFHSSRRLHRSPFYRVRAYYGRRTHKILRQFMRKEVKFSPL